MERTFSKRRYLISTLAAAGLAAVVPACSGQELPPEIDDPIQIAPKPPAALSGGTLLVTAQGQAIAADPDRDLVWVVNLNDRSTSRIDLKTGDEPGRVAVDGAGRAHVVLRRSGSVATLDLAAGKVVDRTAVCAAPRGVAYDSKQDVVHVACAGGELVTLPAAGGAAVRTLHIDKGDLRDVIVTADGLFATRFRTAELLKIADDGTTTSAFAPPAVGVNVGLPPSDPNQGDSGLPQFLPTVAYRAIPLSTGGFLMSHQRSLNSPVVIEQPGGYGSSGGGCDGGIVHPGMTLFDKSGTPEQVPTPAFPGAALPLDIAADTDGQTFAMVAAGSDLVIKTSQANLGQEANMGGVECSTLHESFNVLGEPVAIQFWNSHMVVQTRQPASIQFPDGGGNPILLPGAIDMGDTGHHLFHHAANPKNGLACASCHPEGREDGHTWKFDAIGSRRTQTIGGGVMDTAPLHWDGDMPDMGAIMAEVFVHRMGGATQGPRHVKVLQTWINSVPAFPASAPLVATTNVQHGEQLFNDSTVGCATCHNGSHFTNNKTVDVGTGKPFQVPTLVGVAGRAPYMHDGCADTLEHRFRNQALPACGGGDKHGHTSQLSDQDITDLVSYLKTL